MHFSSSQVVALVVAASFAAGLNVYAMLATLGLLGHYGWVSLPLSLQMLTDWWVIGAAIALFLIEFVADKIPAFDLIWNALHTFVRVPLAALLAYAATSPLSPQAQLLSAALGGTIAMISHGGKIAVRSAVTSSPEPLSNSLLSLGEDVVAVGLTWFATAHPYIAAGITLLLIVLTFFAVKLVIRSMKRLFQAAKQSLFSQPSSHNVAA